jgi:plastocyanin
MTHLSHTFSNLLRIIIAVMACSPAWAATVSGVINISPSEGSAHHEQSRSDVVVWLEPVHPLSSITLKPQHAQLLQKDKMFRPHILVINVGSTVDFPNEDPIFHNAFSTFAGQVFDVGLYPPGTSQPVHFRRPGVVRVFCNIHPSMSAIIVVLDTPYFTKAQRNGQYRILNVPPGEYEVHVFDEQATAGHESQMLLTVEGQPDTIAPPVHLSEVGYVHLPHKNKYGLDYPPSSDAGETYTELPK